MRPSGESPRALDAWYFSWVLGLGFDCTLAVLSAMWLELREDT
ncbi:MAG: cytochrome bd-I oxidase subunit CydX [Alphaproteobacteria bacterium]|nr:cytochrome bd-I oxidase subunit CydX [Alphaproteobacteria bacterium]MBV9693074.1 cytochrome bd-I oxidase subunit CydX [Alphaproteobacteria bacterium]